MRDSLILRERSDRVATQEEVRFASRSGVTSVETSAVVADTLQTAELPRELLLELDDEEFTLVAELLTLGGELVN